MEGKVVGIRNCLPIRSFFLMALAALAALLLASWALASTPAIADPSDQPAGGLRALDGAIDSDGDGCTDDQESGLDETLGGRRDPNNFWDFYDVPLRDKKIDLMNDIFGVAFRFGATGDPEGNPLALPIPASPAYHTAFDRGGVVQGGDPWDLLPADGTIDLMNDIFGVAFQFGHRCS
ncbi:hypothetical protein LCGC14_2693860 [marine sediment metagenome]|uniref:Uncharacterized protein n=1 Tax=marine sediment metagenome TaxID=412755 RepID=A0A0F9BS77_9ZZZZ